MNTILLLPFIFFPFLFIVFGCRVRLSTARWNCRVVPYEKAKKIIIQVLIFFPPLMHPMSLFSNGQTPAAFYYIN